MTAHAGEGPRPSGAALAPIRARYGQWAGADTDDVIADRDEAPERIRAMQIILRMERGADPDWYTALELAARGCAAVCLDARSEPGGDWYDAIRRYADGQIRKVTRRARASRWDAVAELPGVTLTGGDTQVRVLLPGLVADLDKRVAKLQVGGTDAPKTEPEHWAAPNPGALLVHPNPTVGMSLGKTMAQVGHASMIAAAMLAGSDVTTLGSWHAAGMPIAIRPIDAASWLGLVNATADPQTAWRAERMVAVQDAGFTEITPGTTTMVARWGFDGLQR